MVYFFHCAADTGSKKNQDSMGCKIQGVLSQGLCIGVYLFI